MCRRHLICSLVLIVAMVLPALADADKAKKVKEVNVISATGMTPVVVERRLKENEAETGEASLPVALDIADANGWPVANQEFTLKWQDGRKTVTTNKDGVLEITLSKENAASLKLIVPEDFKVTKSGQSRDSYVVSVFGRGGKQTELDTSAMSNITVGKISVCHDPSDRMAAIRILAELSRMRGFMEGFAGLTLLSDYGAVLHRTNGNLVLNNAPGLMIPLRLSNSGQNIDPLEMWALSHEWIESSLVFQIKALFEDPGLRFVGDGLAEYLSYEYSRQFLPENAKRCLSDCARMLTNLKADGVKEFNVSQDFNSQKPISCPSIGYAVSFIYWYRLCHAKSPDVLREFLAWFFENKQANIDQVIAKLTELTDEKTAETTLDTDSLIEYVQKLCKQAEVEAAQVE